MNNTTCFFVFVCVPFTLPRKPITFFFGGGGGWQEKYMRKKEEYHSGFMVSGAHARLLAAFDRSAQYVAGCG